MKIVMGLVIAMFIITAAYVGYHAASDQPVKDAKGHDIAIEPKILNIGFEPLQTLEKSNFFKFPA